MHGLLLPWNGDFHPWAPPNPLITPPPVQECQEQLSSSAARQAANERHIEELHATIQSLTKSKVGAGSRGRGTREGGYGGGGGENSCAS
mgnify:CR=1 FL=1